MSLFHEHYANILPGYPCSWSPCKNYRYSLWRVWGDEMRAVQFIGLNPSTADEDKDDPTVKRCINYAQDWGYGAMCMTNLFGYRATDPDEMKRVDAPISHDTVSNNDQLFAVGEHCKLIVCAWGNHGAHLDRANQTLKFLRSRGLGHKLHCFRYNQSGGGEPAHPLYLPANLQPQRMPA